MSVDTVGSADQQPDDTNIPQFSAGTQSIISSILSPISGLTNFAGNYALVGIGVVLMIGALLISGAHTTVIEQTAKTAAKVGIA